MTWRKSAIIVLALLSIVTAACSDGAVSERAVGERERAVAERELAVAERERAAERERPARPDLVLQILAKLDQGALAFNAPDELRVGQTATVHVAISRQLTEREAGSRIEGPGPRVTASIPMGATMEAKLTGSKADFTIDPLADGLRAVDPRWTEWRWAVTPIRSGTHRLRLEVFVRVQIEGASTPTSVRVYNRDIVVRASPLEAVIAFLKGNWQWLWATLLVPVAPLAWSKLRKNRPLDE